MSISPETIKHLEAVAAHLTELDDGKRWVLKHSPDCDWYVKLVRPNFDEQIHVQLETKSYSGPVVKYIVSGNDPAKYKDFSSYDHHNPKASLSAARPPQDIAKDIARRVLPGYREDLADFEARWQQKNNYLAKRDRLNARMARAAGLETPKAGVNKFGANFRRDKGYTPSVEVQTTVHTTEGDYEQVSVKLEHLTPEVAERVLALVRNLTSK